MVPSELDQKYEVRGTLGAGAMGTVYDALDRMIERRVAIKVVKRPNEGDPEAAEAHARFKREAQAAGRLSHPNIVGVYDYGENADSAWIVMELVEGGSLKDRLDRNERFTVPEIVRLMDQVLAALAYSHGRGVVHRDIKPGNIMLADDGTVKIADFGIARLENSSMTQVGTLIGTPSYMAPEQFRGEPVDARADIWAAGVMLYQLLTGEKPFEGGFSAVMHKALHTEPPPPSQLSVTAPRPFDAVIARALAKRPEDRFPSATAFAEAIRNAASAPAMAEPAPALPGLPGLEEADATLVAGSLPTGATMAAVPRAIAPPAGPAASPAPTPPDRRRRPVGLIAGGGAAALAAAGAAVWFLAIQPEQERARQEQARIEQEARETAERARTAQEQAAREAAALEQAQREVAALEAAAREQAAREQAARDRETAEAAAREAAAREHAARDQAARDQAAQERAVAEAAAREAAIREQAAREQAARDRAAADAAAQAAREQAARDAAAREEADRQRTQQAEAERRAQEARLQATRLDLRSAAQAAVAATPCSLLAWAADDRSLTIAGIARRGEEAVLRRLLLDRGVPEEAARVQVASFDGPYCPALDGFRPVLAAVDSAPNVSVIGSAPLQKGELLRLDVTMPPWPAHLYVAYFMKSGEVVNLVPSQQHQAGARIRLGEPQGQFTGWEVDEPFGTDLAVVIASDRPLFGAARPFVERQEEYLTALTDALRAARQSGSRVQVRPVVVETVARR